MPGRLVVLLSALAGALLLAAPSQSSQLVLRDARHVRLAVNGWGEALLTYHSAGLVRHALAWGPVGAPRERLQVEYRPHWRAFHGACGRYRGPKLAYPVATCTAPDGSHWAVQSVPQPSSTHSWLEISHWTGPLARVQTGMAWAYSGRFQVLFGRVTYAGLPASGALVFLDTLNAGWHRENAFSTHTGTGAFCYGFYPSGGGPGSSYRVAVSGVGLTPLVVRTVRGSHGFNRSSGADITHQLRAAALLQSWGVPATDPDCGAVLRMAAKLKGR